MAAIRIAVVGAGYWGQAHVRTVLASPRCRLTWICDTSDEALSRYRAASGVQLTADFDTVLSAPDVDAVIIATPSSTHADLACRALASGRHALIEKPMAGSSTDADRVAAAAHASGAVVLVGHLMLYHPAIEYLRQLIDGGELGDLHYVTSTRVNLGRLRSDENALWSLGPHDFSMLDYLVRLPARSISAVGESFLQPGIHDVVFLGIEFERPGVPLLAHVHLSWLNPRKERRMVVVGSRKMVEFDDVAHDKLHLHDRGYDRPPPFSSFAEYLTLRDGPVTIPHVPMVEPLAAMIEHFADCIERGVEPRTDVASGQRVVRMLEAAQRALDRRRM